MKLFFINVIVICLTVQNVLCSSADSYKVTGVLSNLLATKTLLLSSRQKFIITGTNRDFSYVHVVPRDIIKQFHFRAELKRSGFATTVMQVSANEKHVTVLVETSKGQPYCLMADHLLVVCDPDKLGGLAYYEGGTVFWGLFQNVQDKTNISFQMSFMATNVPPAAVLDLSFIIKRAWAKKTNAIYEAGSKTIKIQTAKSSEEIELSDATSQGMLGVEDVKLQGEGIEFDFSDFQVETIPMKNLISFSKRVLQGLNVPLRVLNTEEFHQLEMFIPNGFPNNQAEIESSSKIKSLVYFKMN